MISAINWTDTCEKSAAIYDADCAMGFTNATSVSHKPFGAKKVFVKKLADNLFVVSCWLWNTQTPSWKFPHIIIGIPTEFSHISKVLRFIH